ncbi:hypothetical protein DFO45_4334 [Azorhizobium sp. AG788]|nr:hypothetical protein DFO45_4334 [Azorhizobium sp. AG788]
MRNTMRRSLQTSRMRAFLLAASALAATPALFAAAPVAAQTANQLPQSQDGTLMNSIMGAIGIGGDTRPSIDYRERAPLVVPPSAANGELPQPQAPASAKLNNWPKDPDMARAEKANAVDNSPAQRYEDKRDVLLPSELNKGRKANAGKLDGPAQRYEDKRDVLSPSELGFKSWFGITPSDQKPMVFTGEPTRESLTQPPTGYQTPAPNAPYGVVEKKNEPFKFPTLFDRN